MKHFLKAAFWVIISAALFYTGCDNNEEAPSLLSTPFGPKKTERVKITFDHEIYAEIEIPEELTGAPSSGEKALSAEPETPLHTKGNVIVLEISEMPVEIVNPELQNSLLTTRRYGDIEILLAGIKNGEPVFELKATQKQITSLKKDIVNYLNNKNAVFSAVLDNDAERLKELIDGNIDLNVRSVDDVTPLIAATMMNHEEIVEILLDANVDVNAKDHIGWTALIHFASENVSPGIGNALIRANADINARGKYGTTALMAAAMKGNTDLVKTLVKQGADLNASAKFTGEPFTALDAAEKEGYKEIADFLKKSGAK